MRGAVWPSRLHISFPSSLSLARAIAAVPVHCCLHLLASFHKLMRGAFGFPVSSSISPPPLSLARSSPCRFAVASIFSRTIVGWRCRCLRRGLAEQLYAAFVLWFGAANFSRVVGGSAVLCCHVPSSNSPRHREMRAPV